MYNFLLYKKSVFAVITGSKIEFNVWCIILDFIASDAADIYIKDKRSPHISYLGLTLLGLCTWDR